MATQHRQWGGLSNSDIRIKSSVYTHSRFIQTMAADLVFWNAFLSLESSSLFLLLFTVQVPFICLWGHNAQSTVKHSIWVFFLHVGWCYWKLSGSFFMWAELQRAWPWACLRPGSAPLCSGLATKWISLSCGPWPPDAFPDPGNRINTSALALGSHSPIHSCALAWPSPVRRS